jgi:DHA1 family tetracycline resistance protein-like MFS transporter
MSSAPERDSSLRPLLPVLLTVLIDLLGFGLVIPLLSYYAEEHGANPVQVTLLMASYSIAQFFFAPFWGLVSDRIGRRPVMLVSIAGTALSLAGFAASGSLPLLFLFRTLNGACAANISTAQAFVADLTTPENRAKGMGLIGAAFGLGFSLGPWIGGELAHFGLSTPIWAAAGLSAVNFVWAAWALPESRPTTRSARSIDPRALAAGILHPIVGLAILLTFAATFAFSMMEATFALVAEHAWGMGPMQVGRMFLVIGVVGIVIQGGLIGRLARRFGEPALVLAGMGSNGLGLAALAVASLGNGDDPTSLVARWVGCVLVAVGSSLANPALSALISRGVDSDEQGAILGANQSLGALARATAPTIGGLFYHHWFRGGAFLAGAVMLILTLPLALPAVRRAHRAA